MLSEKLDTWRQELPDYLHLQILVAEPSAAAVANKHALILAHILYLESRLFPYQRKMQVSGTAEILCIPEHALFTYTGFARQLAWLVSLTYRDGQYVRCWLVM